MVSKFKLDTAKSAEKKDALNLTFEIANSYAGELSIEVIPLDKVELDPENKRDLELTLEDAINGIDKNDPLLNRKKQDIKSLESLSKTIKNDQLINPIFVYRYGNKCRLIAGERRTLATALAGKKEIIARIANERPIGTKLRILQWIENNERSDLGLPERLASIEAILETYFAEHKIEPNIKNVTAKTLSELISISQTQARRYLLILQAKPSIRDAIEKGQLDNVKLIELICSAKNEEQQTILLEAALSGKSFEAIEEIKKQIEVNLKNLQELQKPKQKGPGRRKESVSLGRFQPDFVKQVIEALINSTYFEKSMISKMDEIHKSLAWDDIHEVEDGFKKIASLIASGV